jgi:predicted dehydrogenase
MHEFSAAHGRRWPVRLAYGDPMRFGLIGTGYWAREAHAAGIAATDGAELVGVWGRNPAKARELADQAGITAFGTVDALLDAVDAVTFAVPPDVQAPLAIAAASRGRHLLLEKPLALSSSQAAEVADAVADAGVASVVFFIDRFTPEARAWWAGVDGGVWEGGLSLWLANAFHEGSHFATPWRRVHGGLWDVGPHAVADLVRALGAVTELQATRGVRDLVHLTLRHESGASSTALLTLTAPVPAVRVSLDLWGPVGWATLPLRASPASEALRQAATELMTAARAADGGGTPVHPVDAAFGSSVVDLLARAQRQIESA